MVSFLLWKAMTHRNASALAVHQCSSNAEKQLKVRRNIPLFFITAQQPYTARRTTIAACDDAFSYNTWGFYLTFFSIDDSTS